MTYRFGGNLSEQDIEDGVWDDEAELIQQQRFSEDIPTPKQKAKCQCGADQHTVFAGMPFCSVCIGKLVQCFVCDHAGTEGDFSRLFDDEVVTMCPACGAVESARKVAAR